MFMGWASMALWCPYVMGRGRVGLDIRGTNGLFISLVAVQARVQGTRPVRHRLNSPTVEASVWLGEGCVCTEVRQEHADDLPEPAEMPARG